MSTHNHATPKCSHQVMGPGNNTPSSDDQFAKREGDKKGEETEKEWEERMELEKKEWEERNELENELETIRRFLQEEQPDSLEVNQRFLDEYCSTKQKRYGFVKCETVKNGYTIKVVNNVEKSRVEEKSVNGLSISPHDHEKAKPASQAYIASQYESAGAPSQI